MLLATGSTSRPRSLLLLLLASLVLLCALSVSALPLKPKRNDLKESLRRTRLRHSVSIPLNSNNPLGAASTGPRKHTASVPDTPFTQPESLRFTYAGTAAVADWTVTSVPPIVHVEADQNNAGGAFLLGNTTCHYIDSNNVITDLSATWSDLVPGSALVSNGSPSRSFDFALATPSNVHRCKISIVSDKASVSCDTPSAFGLPVLSLAVDATDTVWIGSSQGLYSLSSASAASVARDTGIPAVPVPAVAFDSASSVLIAGTGLKNWRRVGTNNNSWYGTYTGGIIDNNITAVTFGSDSTLYVGNNQAVNVQSPDLSYERYAGFQGLPYANITSMARQVPALSQSENNPVWIGTLFGAIRWNVNDNTWLYFNGARFLPTAQGVTQSRVSGLALLVSPSGSPEQAIVATDFGFARITLSVWTLASKAAHYQSLVYPRHDRYGLTADCSLKQYGNLSSYQLHTTDNDGLWTSLYLASQSFRYAVTKDPEARANALKAFTALEFLNNVTCIKGFMGRSFCKVGDEHGAGGGKDIFRNSTCYPGWMFKADTSSDEVTGHLFAYPIFYDLVAETPDEKARALRLIDNITGGIVAHNFTLIGYLGTPTTWGHWNPDYLNDYPSWYDNRGVNSLQILGYLLSAYRVTNDTKYMDAMTMLRDQYGYGTNIINQKITWPEDDNFSDDELAWLPYFTIFWSKNAEALGSDYKLSIDRAFRIATREKSSLWNMIYGAARQLKSDDSDTFNLADAIETLQQWPLEQIDWPTVNSQRLDVTPDRDVTRSNSKQLHTLVSYDERSMFRWNGNPFVPNGGSGMSEYDPSAWLLPYWMGRYFGFIEMS